MKILHDDRAGFRVQAEKTLIPQNPPAAGALQISFQLLINNGGKQYSSHMQRDKPIIAYMRPEKAVTIPDIQQSVVRAGAAHDALNDADLPIIPVPVPHPPEGRRERSIETINHQQGPRRYGDRPAHREAILKDHDAAHRA